MSREHTMTRQARLSFIGLAIITTLLPWLVLFVGRSVFILSVFWLLALLLLISSIALLRKNFQLAIAGFGALLLTFLSMMIVPSLARGW
jgi:hypothetical protein